jgi:hypothetical protein
MRDIRPELLDELLSGHEKPSDLLVHSVIDSAAVL